MADTVTTLRFPGHLWLRWRSSDPFALIDWQTAHDLINGWVMLPSLPRCRILFRHAAVLVTSVALLETAGAADVLTWHNDLARTGLNPAETILTPANVNANNFGKLFVIPVDGQVYAQPLVVSGLTIPTKGVRDVVYIATEHNSVYACDAHAGTVLWQISLNLSGETSKAPPRFCNDLLPEFGVTATPVIDRSAGPNGTIYVAANSEAGVSSPIHRLHALDLATGAQRPNSPVQIAASYPGTGTGGDGTTLTFSPAFYTERAGLVLSGGVIYTTWASHCDFRPYNGWVIAYDQTTLARVGVLNLTPNGADGAIWSSGAAPAVDAEGNLYVMTGNGTFDTTLDVNGNPVNANYGNAFVKISPASAGLRVLDYWTMFDTVAQTNADRDLGAGGPILLPDMTDIDGITRQLLVGSGKDGHSYVLERNRMGKFNAASNSTMYQDVTGSHGAIFGAPAFFNGRLYFGAHQSTLRAFTFTNALLNSLSESRSTFLFPFPGTTPSVSANGTADGIVWALANGTTAALYAFDAADLARELYNSNLAPNGRDQFGAGTKFFVPTVANGKVYVGTTSGRVAVFGMFAVPQPTPAYADSNPYTDTNSHADSNPYTDTDPHTNTDPNSHAHTNADPGSGSCYSRHHTQWRQF